MIKKTEPQLPTRLIPFIWYFLKNYKLLFFLSTMGTIAWTVCSSISPFIMKKLIDLLPTLDISNFTESFLQALPLVLLVILMEIICFGHAVVKFANAKLYPQLTLDIKEQCYQYTSFHSSKYFANNFAGAIAGKINNLGSHVEQLLDLFTAKLFQESACFFIMITVMFFTNKIIALAFLLWFIITFTILIKMGKSCEKKSSKFTSANLNSNGHLIDCLENNNIVKSFCAETLTTKFFKTILNKEKAKAIDLKTSTSVLDLVLRIAMLVLSSFVRFSLVIGFLKGWLTIGEIVLIIAYQGRLAYIVWIITESLTPFFTNLGVVKKSIEVITTPHDIKDSSKAKPLQLQSGEVDIKKINFSYQDEDDMGKTFTTHVFKNLNLHIKPKEKIGIVGLSGAGKSSLATLLLRFYDHQKGSIEIDKQEIKDVTLQSLRKSITFIPQDTSLFHRSLLDNIKLGNNKANQEDVEKAAKLAHAHGFILQTPQGYNTMVGERGVKLSGGQRQRIAIARAFLKDSPILILDEATSALDSDSETKIQESLTVLMQNKTTIVIAHRLSTLKQMDRIIVLDKGQIVEEGTHKELSNAKGIYQKMWSLQTQNK